MALDAQKNMGMWGNMGYCLPCLRVSQNRRVGRKRRLFT